MLGTTLGKVIRITKRLWVCLPFALLSLDALGLYDLRRLLTWEVTLRFGCSSGPCYEIGGFRQITPESKRSLNRGFGCLDMKRLGVTPPHSGMRTCSAMPPPCLWTSSISEDHPLNSLYSFVCAI